MKTKTNKLKRMLTALALVCAFSCSLLTGCSLFPEKEQASLAPNFDLEVQESVINPNLELAISKSVAFSATETSDAYIGRVVKATLHLYSGITSNENPEFELVNPLTWSLTWAGVGSGEPTSYVSIETRTDYTHTATLKCFKDFSFSDMYLTCSTVDGTISSTCRLRYIGVPYNMGIDTSNYTKVSVTTTDYEGDVNGSIDSAIVLPYSDNSYDFPIAYESALGVGSNYVRDFTITTYMVGGPSFTAGMGYLTINESFRRVTFENNVYTLELYREGFDVAFTICTIAIVDDVVKVTCPNLEDKTFNYNDEAYQFYRYGTRYNGFGGMQLEITLSENTLNVVKTLKLVFVAGEPSISLDNSLIEF